MVSYQFKLLIQAAKCICNSSAEVKFQCELLNRLSDKRRVFKTNLSC